MFGSTSNKKQRNIIIASLILVVLLISSITAFAIFHKPTSEQTPTKLGLSVSMNQTDVTQGSSLQAEVNVTSIGSAKNVSLGSDVGSSGIGYSFEPAMGSSNFTSLLTMNVPDSTPTGNYSVTVTASAGGVTQNASYIVSVLSANVTVSGTVRAGGFVGFNVGLHQIEFVDTQTNSTIVVALPSAFPLATEFASGAYSVTLQNEHTYNVTVSVYWGRGEVATPYTFDGGDLYVYAPAGNSTMSGQNYTFSL